MEHEIKVVELFADNLEVPLSGRTSHSNLFFVPQKKIFTSIPNAISSII
jgi:hypothetical protein